MTKNRIWLIVGVLGIIILISLFISLLFSQPNQGGQVGPSSSIPPEQIEFAPQPDYSLLEPAPTPSPLEVPPTATITVDGVQVQNFYSTSRSVDSEGTLELTTNDNFTVLYFPQDQSFLISVTGSPFETYRQQAESFLVATLNVSEATACELNVNISTPEYANPNEAGTNYPLSFCPGN